MNFYHRKTLRATGLVYRGRVSWFVVTLAKIKTSVLNNPLLIAFGEDIRVQAQLKNPLLFLRSSKIKYPRSYKFFLIDVIEMPEQYLKISTMSHEGMGVLKGTIAHEVAHLKYHAMKLELANLASGITLLSNNLLTLSINLTKYEMEADNWATKYIGSSKPVKDALLYAILSSASTPSVKLGLISNYKSIMEFMFGHDSLGYIYPSIPFRLTALDNTAK